MTDVSSTNIQDDWKQREVAEIIQVQISKMTDFLNKGIIKFNKLNYNYK